MSVKKINPPERVESDFARMGEQLTAQYKRAVSGMVEVLRFGAMLQHVRGIIVNDSNVESLRGGRDMKGQGLKAWLAEFAPDVKISTAWRFLGVAEAVAEDFAEIVGARIANKYSLPELVLGEDLPKQARAKQLELFDYVSGTSQRSWLDRFKAPEPTTPRGGAREGAGRPPKDVEAEAAIAKSEWELLHVELRRLMAKDMSFVHLDLERLRELDADLMDLRRQMKTVLKGEGHV